MTKTKLKNNTYMFAVGICLLIFGWAAYFAGSHSISGVELTIFRWINGLPEGLKWPMWVITQVGGAWGLFAITLVLVRQKYYQVAVRIFGLGGTAYVGSYVLKQLIGRLRPEGLLANIHLRTGLEGGYGFPSGHVTVSTVVSLVLMPFLPSKLRWLAFAWIILVAVSRIYLGVHAPLDVVGGFAVGSTVVLASLLVQGKLQFIKRITHMKLG